MTVVLVYLELPLRAGPFRAPLVYGQPETWDGFWYIVLAEQFRGSVVDPFGDLPAQARRRSSIGPSARSARSRRCSRSAFVATASAGRAMRC